MKARRVGNLYEVQYRVPGIPIPIKERFETKEEADVRIAEVKLGKKRKNLVPPRSWLERHGYSVRYSSSPISGTGTSEPSRRWIWTATTTSSSTRKRWFSPATPTRRSMWDIR